MDWFSFFAGALTGWIVEWLIDLFYWRRKQGRWSEERTRLQADLAHGNEVIGGLRTRDADLNQQLSIARGDLSAANNNAHLLGGELDSARAQMEALKQELAQAAANQNALADQLNSAVAAANAEAAALREQLAQVEADSQVLLADNSLLRARAAEAEGNATRFAAVGALAAAAAAEAEAQAQRDDLTIIEGVGPKIAELLNDNNLYTFADVANTSVDDLETILRSGGSRFQTANPETWPRQAKLAANREWPRLDLLKAQLKGGVRRPEGEAPATRSQPVPTPADDLTMIEGIGPKIAEILQQNGIRTFAQLARMEPARLRLLLMEAGPAYRIADPTSWPEQASWAAVGNWDRLQALKDQLDAGRAKQ
jgi:predicted flap endonuclease-1-like 5' DNA nuclease